MFDDPLSALDAKVRRLPMLTPANFHVMLAGWYTLCCAPAWYCISSGGLRVLPGTLGRDMRCPEVQPFCTATDVQWHEPSLCCEVDVSLQLA